MFCAHFVLIIDILWLSICYSYKEQYYHSFRVCFWLNSNINCFVSFQSYVPVFLDKRFTIEWSVYKHTFNFFKS